MYHTQGVLVRVIICAFMKSSFAFLSVLLEISQFFSISRGFLPIRILACLKFFRILLSPQSSILLFSELIQYHAARDISSASTLPNRCILYLSEIVKDLAVLVLSNLAPSQE